MTQRRPKLAIVVPAAFGLIVVIIFGFLAASVLYVRSVSYDRLLLDNGRATHAVGTRMLFNPLYTLDVETLQRTVDRFLGETNITHAAVRDLDGRVVAVTTEGWLPDAEVSRDLAVQALVEGGIVQRDADDYLILVGPIAMGAEQIGTLELVFDAASFQATGASGMQFLVPVSIGIIAVGLLAVILLARSVGRYLWTLTAAAEEIGVGNLELPVPIVGFEESARLGMALERMRVQLQEAYGNLERQAAAQERRANRLRAVADFAQETALEVDVSELLQLVVTSIREQFGFYHAGIYIVDESGDWAELRAATSEGGQRMLARGHKLRVGQEGMVGYVVGRGIRRLAQNVETDTVFVASPDLPDTRSALVLPLRARGDVIGALDVQATKPDAFGDEDIEASQVLANQLALAISNAQLFGQARESLMAAERAYGKLGREAWAQAVRARRVMGYYCDKKRVVPVTARERHGDDSNLPMASIPLTMRGQVIGAVDAHKPDGARDWTPEELALLETLVDRLEVALDSARLYQDTQRRAAQERLVAEVTARMRESLDVETVLQTAAQEMREILDLAEVELRIHGGYGTSA